MVPRPAATDLLLADAQLQPRGPGPLQMAIEGRFGNRRLEFGLEKLVDRHVGPVRLLLLQFDGLGDHRLRGLAGLAPVAPPLAEQGLETAVAVLLPLPPQRGPRRPATLPVREDLLGRGQLVQKATGLFRRNLSVEQADSAANTRKRPTVLVDPASEALLSARLARANRSLPHDQPWARCIAGEDSLAKQPLADAVRRQQLHGLAGACLAAAGSGTSRAARPTAGGAAWSWALSGESAPRRPAACSASLPATTTTARPCWGPSPAVALFWPAWCGRRT